MQFLDVNPATKVENCLSLYKITPGSVIWLMDWASCNLTSNTEKNAPKMEVYVKMQKENATAGHQTFILQLEKLATVADLKKAIYDASRVHPDRQQLLYGIKPLVQTPEGTSNPKKLSDYGIAHQSTVCLLEQIHHYEIHIKYREKYLALKVYN